MESISQLIQSFEIYLNENPYVMVLIIAIMIWKLIWYGLAIYRTIENKQKIWFVVLFVCSIVLNDLGLLPILYILFDNNKKSKRGLNKSPKKLLNKKK